MRIQDLISDRIFQLIIVSLVLLIVIEILINRNKKTEKEIRNEREKQNYYEKEIEKLTAMNAPAKMKFQLLNELAREMFKEKFNLSYSLTYKDLEEYFQDKLPVLSEFCKKMGRLDYAKRKVSSNEISELLDLIYPVTKSLQ